MLLLNADNVVFFENTLGDAQNLVKAMIFFCMHTKLSVNKSKTKIMLVKIQKRNMFAFTKYFRRCTKPCEGNEFFLHAY